MYLLRQKKMEAKRTDYGTEKRSQLPFSEKQGMERMRIPKKDENRKGFQLELTIFYF